MRWIERQKYFIDFALSSLMRRWKKNLALTILYAFMIFILASVILFTQAIKNEAQTVLQGSPDIIVQRIVAGRHDLLPAGYLKTLQTITGTSNIRGRLWAYYHDPLTRANYTILGTDGIEKRDHAVAVGRGVARAMGIIKGDSVNLRRHDGTYQAFTVKALFPGVSELESADLILMSEYDFRSLFNVSDNLFTDAAVSVKNPMETGAASKKILRKLPDTRTVARDDILKTYDAIFAWRSGILLIIFSGTLLAFMIFAWDKAAGLNLEEKKEIGILKAVGWNTREVLMLKTWEGLIISASAFLAGFIFAYAHVFFGSRTIFEPALKGWAVLYPRFRLIPAVDAYQVIALLFLSVLPYMAATVIPSWLAAVTDPDAVMRF